MNYIDYLENIKIISFGNKIKDTAIGIGTAAFFTAMPLVSGGCANDYREEDNKPFKDGFTVADYLFVANGYADLHVQLTTDKDNDDSKEKQKSQIKPKKLEVALSDTTKAVFSLIPSSYLNENEMANIHLPTGEMDEKYASGTFTLVTLLLDTRNPRIPDAKIYDVGYMRKNVHNKNGARNSTIDALFGLQDGVKSQFYNSKQGKWVSRSHEWDDVYKNALSAAAEQIDKKYNSVKDKYRQRQKQPEKAVQKQGTK